MMVSLKKTFALLSPKSKLVLIWLFMAVILMGMVELLSVSLIFPFISVLTNPEIIQGNKWLSFAYHTINFTSERNFTLTLGGIVLSFLILGNAFSAFVSWLILRFSYHQGHNISYQLLNNYLSQEYQFFLHRNSSELCRNILSEVHRIVEGIVSPALLTLSKSVLIASIMGMLFLVNWKLTLALVSTLGGGYFIVFYFIKNKLRNKGILSVKASEGRYKYSYEALAGIKDIKVAGCEREYLHRYSEQSILYSKVEASAQLIPQLTRYGLEGVAFSVVIVVLMYQYMLGYSLNTMLPMVSLYVFSGYRMMPAFQQIFTSLSSIRYHSSALGVIYADMVELEPKEDLSLCEVERPLHVKLTFNNITFTYPNAERRSLNDINIELPARQMIGFVGSSGAGKTTLVDVLLGLLSPQTGEIKIDGQNLSRENMRAWRKNIGYVPQDIFLADDTIRNNINFGVPDEEHSDEKLYRAAKLANIHEFIITELPDDYNTLVGERGVRLSGGQRQRLGLARALYHDPSLLVLDEATSSLDSNTESQIMKAINSLAGSKTIIIVAHRMTTIAKCDRVYLLKEGRVLTYGTYEQLKSDSLDFQKLENIA